MLIGNIYQIEAIKFGNLFNFARYFVDKKSVYELVTPYRAKDKSILLDMWTCVRNFDEKISHNIFYTAITRTTDKLKVYISKETQKKLAEKFVKSNVELKQAQLFAGHAGLKLKNKLSS